MSSSSRSLFHLSVAALMLGGACHRTPVAETTPEIGFDTSRKLVTGQHDKIVEAAIRGVTQNGLTVERQFISMSQSTVIIAHPTNLPNSTGSIEIALNESGSDDTSILIRVSKALLSSKLDRSALASRIFAAIDTARAR